ncbi:hypothetical protein [Stieleria mannarensis]|uniref:hypothetical protein n=1 Tax=Stieleria mannarensis TaxID=2755585 RepID=UPI001603C76E|nr:hypothetical protein [Rhodopirellula sp. JC639]
MRRRYKIYRGDQLLGFVGFDDQSPCEPFEPTEAFIGVEALFEKENELAKLAAEADAARDLARFDQLIDEMNQVMDEIVAPGVRFEAMESILGSFECDQLSIFDGRVCWR